jgi:hypothetical protein
MFVWSTAPNRTGIWGTGVAYLGTRYDLTSPLASLRPSPHQHRQLHYVQAGDAEDGRNPVAAPAAAGHVLGFHHQEQQRRVAD